MKNILPKLTEKVTLLENSELVNGTTVAKFKDSIEARAAISGIFNLGGWSSDMFEVIILKPPRGFSKINFTGLKRQNEIYIYKDPFQTLHTRFLKGTIIKWK
ncbi:MAG: hypothetical protein LBE97_00030 [Holosporales bacterium]|jgi:hypothetical protein|nr:hypothetical protein [Holosporales bacterium]